MHEIGIAASVLESVRAELARHPGSRGLEVGLKVGELSGVEPEALRFSFQALLAGSELAELHVEIEACPRRYRCPRCGMEYIAPGWELACPECGERNAQCVSGTELELSYLELEEP
jgi:hydrogenase nickel incorporation protein HypA/HybF